MEIDRVYAIGLLGLLATFLVGYQSFRAARWAYHRWSTLCRYVDTHLALPKIFQGRLFCNPTRSEALCHLLHWISVVVFDTYRVTTLSAAEERTAQLAVIHLVPVTVSFQLSQIANTLGWTAVTVSKVHAAFGLMATLHGVAHACMHLWARHDSAHQAVPGILCMTALLALTLLPGVRRFAYEAFLYVHRAFALLIMAALWVHVADSRSFSRLLVVVALCCIAGTTALRSILQVFRNFALRRWSVHSTKIIGITRAGDALILRVELPRPCVMRPGQYFHVTILTWRLGFALQRHPLTVAWWDAPEDRGHPQILYFVVEPRRGWTKSLQKHYTEIFANISSHSTAHSTRREDRTRDSDYACRQRVWLDGPFGSIPDWKTFDTFLLFASREGVFAQLSWLKFLTDRSKIEPYAIRKIVLAWEADEPHFTLSQWIQSILEDPHVRRDLLEIHTYFPRDSFDRLPSNESAGGERLKVVPRSSIDVGKFFNSEDFPDLLQRTSKDTAVIVSGDRTLRDNVRAQVLSLGRIDVRFSESEYQPAEV